MQYPDYDNCLVNLANSVLRSFGVQAGADMPRLTPVLDRYENVVILLLDSMGTYNLREHLAPEGFFLRHLAGSYSSVFPPTTVAATTSLQSGLAPVEHSWLGWDCYYPALDANVTVFTGNLQSTRTPAAAFDAATTLCPYESIVDKIRSAGGQAYFATPHNAPYPKDLEDILERVQSLCALPGRKFIYSYWNEPDSTMHTTGATSLQTKQVLQALEARMEALCQALPEDALVIFTADHGHIDCRSLAITDYPDLTNCLLRMPSIEPRALNFYVRPGMEEEFRRAFLSHFGDAFALLSHREVLDRQLFGRGTPHEAFDAMLGDFLAVATGDISLFNTWEEAQIVVGAHAGMTAAEMTIPLILCKGGCHE